LFDIESNHRGFSVFVPCFLYVFPVFVSYPIYQTNMEKTRVRYESDTEKPRWFLPVSNNIQTFIKRLSGHVPGEFDFLLKRGL